MFQIGTIVTRHMLTLVLVLASVDVLHAQDAIMRQKLEFDGTGLFPVSGYKADEYSVGPGFRVGYELRLHKHVAADAGWTAAWLDGTSCSRYGCDYPRYQNRLLDFGLRGVLPLQGGRVELSLGIGGGYIWFDPASGDSYFSNTTLLQYSGKMAVAIDRNRHVRLDFSLRMWRDVGRPTQQWLATSAGISYGFGRVQ